MLCNPTRYSALNASGKDDLDIFHRLQPSWRGHGHIYLTKFRRLRLSAKSAGRGERKLSGESVRKTHSVYCMYLAAQGNLCAMELVIPEKRELNFGLENQAC